MPGEGRPLGRPARCPPGPLRRSAAPLRGVSLERSVEAGAGHGGWVDWVGRGLFEACVLRASPEDRKSVV